MNDQVTNLAGLEESGNETQLVSALARGIGILQCFSVANQELGIKELLEKTGLSKPTLFRLVNTLCELGVLRYSERMSKYVLGTGLLNFAAPILSRITIRQFVRPLMRELAEHCGGRVSLAVGHQLNMVFVEIVEGAKNAVYRPEVGTKLSLSRTASGRAYLAMLSAEERERFIRKVRAVDSGKADWLVERLTETQQDLTQRGFCTSHGDFQSELEAIAVPVSFPIDGEIWVFGCIVPVFNLTANQLVDDLSPRLISLVRGVEAAMGSGTGAVKYGVNI